MFLIFYFNLKRISNQYAKIIAKLFVKSLNFCCTAESREKELATFRLEQIGFKKALGLWFGLGLGLGVRLVFGRPRLGISTRVPLIE